MTLLYVRSPYTISIDEVGQVGSKIELRVWYNGDTKPTDATYTLTKQIPSITSTETYYNISPYIKDFILNINPETVLLEDIEKKEMYCLVEVITYYTTDGETYTLIDTLDFVAVNGYTNPNLGANQSNVETAIYLTDSNIEVITDLGATTFSSTQNVPYFNLLIDWDAIATETIRYKYVDLNGGNVAFQTILTDADAIGIYNFKVPYRLNGSVYASGNTIQVLDSRRTGGVIPLPIITYKTECEAKYTPVRCDFINRSGGWQTITFFKAQTNSFDIKSSDFSTLPNEWDYNPLIGGSTSFNIDAKQSVKLNTGWVKENYINFIFDLSVSEKVLLDGIPAKVKSKNLASKTKIKDKNINYEIDFEYTYNLINDVQ
jgi:hypothetical protein